MPMDKNLLSLRKFEKILTKQNWKVIVKEKNTVTMMVNIEFIVIF